MVTYRVFTSHEQDPEFSSRRRFLKQSGKTVLAASAFSSPVKGQVGQSKPAFAYAVLKM